MSLKFALKFTKYCRSIVLINYLPRGSKFSILQCMWTRWHTHFFVFEIKLFSDLISKAFVYKTTWHHQVFQIITHQPRDTNLLFLQGHLKSAKSTCTCLCFGDLQRDRERQRERERASERERRRPTWQGKFSEKYHFFAVCLLKF